jgi:hypothetical protein
MYIFLLDKEYNKFITYFNRFNNAILNKLKCNFINYFIKCNLKELIK